MRHLIAAKGLQRAVSAPLATLHLALVLGAGHHVGDHADDLIDWLPAEYHEHHHALSDSPVELAMSADECVACKLSRTETTLPEAELVDDDRPAIADSRLESQWLAPTGPDLTTRTNRGPPLG